MPELRLDPDTSLRPMSKSSLRTRLRRFYERRLPLQWQVERKLLRVDRDYQRHLKDVKTPDQRDELQWDHAQERQEIIESFETVVSMWLVARARRFHLATPPIPA